MGDVYINNNKDKTPDNGEDEKEILTPITAEPKPETEIVSAEKGKFSPYMEKFLSSFENEIKSEKSASGSTIKVSDVLGGLARLYERIRSVVEYKGEHVLRRNAIERILKRLVWQQGTVREIADLKKVASSLIRELIWARYLPNNVVDKSKVDEVSEAVSKYLYFLRNLDSIPSGISPSKIRTWIWGVASSEIEDLLDPSNRELYVNLMFDWFKSRFEWTDKNLTEHEKDIQIYLAIHRSHAKSDEPIMRYNLLLKEVPSWKNPDKELLNQFILKFSKFYDEIEGHIEYKGRFSLYRRMHRHSAAFDIFRELASFERLNLRKLLEDRKAFEDKIRDLCEVKYAQIRKKVSTGIVRSIIYIFITKVVIAMLLEIPYEIFMYNEVRYIPLTINIIFPPIMMWLIGLSTRIPGAKNTEGIINRLSSVVYPSEEIIPQPFSVQAPLRSGSLSTVFSVIYAVLFLLVFGGISYLLTLIDFSMVGIVVFFFFLSLVILFAYRVRYNAVQLKVDSDNEGFMEHLGSYLTLPFLNFGFLLSKGLAKINFLSVVLDFLIEAPLKSIIEIFEEWTTFIKEKKEEVVELPEP